MKVSLCLSGQPRINQDVLQNHIQVINMGLTEVFVHGWWDDSHRNKTVMFHSTEKFSNEDLGKAFINAYSAKQSQIQDYQEFDLSFCKSHNYDTWKDVPQKHLDIFTPALLYGQLSQTFSIMKSVEMSLGNSADVIVRSRPDVVFTKNIHELVKLLPLKDDEIYFQSSMDGGHIYSGEFPNNPCDWFYCGSPKSMELYTKSSHESIRFSCRNGVRHVREMAMIAAERAGLKVILCDFGALVYRQLIKNNNHRKIELYYDEFDSKDLRITHNHEQWPLFHEKIDFRFLSR